jgi:hypothetical protein
MTSKRKDLRGGKKTAFGALKGARRTQNANHAPAAKPVSLRPLSFEDAVAGLAAVNPKEPKHHKSK